MKVISLSEIKRVIDTVSPNDRIKCLEDAFVAYSTGDANIPPVGYLGFDKPPGDVHIKYGYIPGDAYYVIKIASGFYENSDLGLPPGNGMMIVFDRLTGTPVCLLQDEGYLTDLRTALAGAVAAKYLMPEKVNAIGIIGTGVQARMQLEMLKLVTDCRKVFVWGRSGEKMKSYIKDMTGHGFELTACSSPGEVAASGNLIVTTTPSGKPLLFEKDIQPGTHITAMGSDAPGKQELDPKILEGATILACDSKSQCIDHGEVHYALKEGGIHEEKLIEIGDLIRDPIRRGAEDITIADLTGIATQDIKIASLVIDRIPV